MKKAIKRANAASLTEDEEPESKQPASGSNNNGGKKKIFDDKTPLVTTKQTEDLVQGAARGSKCPPTDPAIAAPAQKKQKKDNKWSK